jgi:uncharacterized membrane protein YphA (DoxX/SURF4 family)
MNILLWIVQGALCAMFLYVGFLKLIKPREALEQSLGSWVNSVTAGQLKVIGLLEVAGAAGLILPMYLDIYPILTPIAAIGLGITMIGAIMTHLNRNENKNMVTNIIILGFCLFVAIGRLLLEPVIDINF